MIPIERITYASRRGRALHFRPKCPTLVHLNHVYRVDEMLILCNEK
jgi:hypothetical protein